MTFIKKHLTPVTITIFLLVILVFGVVYNIHFQKNITRRKEVAPLVAAYPTGQEFKKVEDFKGLSDTIDSKKVEVLEAYQVYEEKVLVGVVYIGITDGYAKDLKVAYGIKYDNHEIVGMNIVSSNETPNFIKALFEKETFVKQFNKKALSDEDFKVDTVTGATPNTGKTGVIAPVTTAGLNRIMKLVREQYAKDSNGNFKVPDLAKLISKKQNYLSLDEFIYVLEVEKEDMKTEITITTNKTFEIQTITPAEFDTAEFKEKFAIVINSNKITTLITEIEEVEGNKVLTITSPGYAGAVVSKVTLNNNGAIIDMISNTSNESYDDEYNSWDPNDGRPADVLPGKIIESQSPDVDKIAAATVTSNAIKNAARVAFEYAKEVIK